MGHVTELSAPLLSRFWRNAVAVLLTRDNVQLNKKTKEWYGVPRDNCIFELGLFVGAFGGSKRCFLISELEHEVLVEQLSDVGGLLYWNLKQKPGTNEIAEWIWGQVEERGRFANRPRFADMDGCAVCLRVTCGYFCHTNCLGR